MRLITPGNVFSMAKADFISAYYMSVAYDRLRQESDRSAAENRSNGGASERKPTTRSVPSVRRAQRVPT